MAKISEKKDSGQMRSSKSNTRSDSMVLGQLWTIFSESTIPTLIRDNENSQIILYNDAMKKLTGYDHAEVQNIETWVERIYPDPKRKSESLNLIFKSFQRQSLVKDVEFIITRKDGCKRNVEFSVYNLFKEKQKTPYQMLQGIDITSHRNIQKELTQLNQELEDRVKKRTMQLEESQARLQMALEGAQEGLWVIDFIQGEMKFTPHSAKMLGYDLDDLGTTSTKWDQITHPDDWPNVEKALLDHFSGKTEYYEQQYRAQTKDGQWKWILGHGRVTKRDEQGNPIQAIGTHVDINNLKMTEIQLRKSEQKFKLLVEDAPFGLLILNEKRQIEYFNPKFYDLFGYTSEELPDLESWLLKAYPDEKYRKKAAKIWEGIFRKSYSRGERVSSLRLTVRCNDSKEKMIKFNHIYLGNNRYLVSYEDVTAQTLAEITVKEHERELKFKNDELIEVNNALRVLLKRIERDKSELEEKILLNIKDLVIPCLDSLENTRLSDRQKSYIDILKSNLNEIVSPFSQKLSASHLYLTPKEIQVANLVKENKETKEISDLLNISISAVQFHRHNIRKKLGLIDKKVNLQAFLNSLNVSQ